MNIDLEQAIENFKSRASRYAKSERYYRGDHNLAFATKKFENAFGSLFREFALNLCPAVCDAVKDKLRITEFSIADKGVQSASKERDKSRTLSEDINRMWQANRMGVRAGEVHKEALKNGDAYLIVWPNANGEAALYPNKASTCAVFYDEESPGKILWAAKYWRMPDKRIRLNLFYPERIEKYVSRDECHGAIVEAGEFVPFVQSAGNRASNGRDKSRTLNNPYGVVPVFHFANNSDIGMPGVSELDPAIPVQDGLNKSVLDMLVAMEYSAYRQRWVAGIEIEIDKVTGEAIAPFKAGVDHLWISQNPEARFGDFNSSDLEQFLKVKDSFRLDIASVTGTPLHYLQPQTQAMPSGESLRRAESRFVAKVRDRQEAFGQVWADAMSLAVKIEGLGSDVRLLTKWEDPASFSECEILENILLKMRIGISTEQALVEAGYGAEDVRKWRDER